MTPRLFASVWLVMATTIGPASAEDGAMTKGVVELFTSQGCSSCPPADKAMEKLATSGDVVALSYHVDYWNYLGWADTLASPENTARQYAYARAFGRSGVYTPQAVINGRDHVAGGDMKAIVGKMEGLRHSGHGVSVSVSAEQRGDEIEIRIGAGQGKADVVMVYYRQRQDVAVLKGENRGKTITYWNSVTDVQTVGMWHGRDMKLTLPAKLLRSGKSDGCAVLLQASSPKGEPAAIVGATVVKTESAQLTP